MVALIAAVLSFLLPCAALEALRRAARRGRERREWKWIKARYFGG
nr:MAG TPA: hypothetical protein [Caudoviricetes sp.]